MTTELKPFTRADLMKFRFQEEEREKRAAERSVYIVKEVYKKILQYIVCDPRRDIYSYTIRDYPTVDHTEAIDVSLPKIASLFPDFQVEGIYTFHDGDPAREKGAPYFEYKITVTVKQN